MYIKEVELQQATLPQCYSISTLKMFSSPKINDWKPGVHDLYAAILFPVKHALICATTMLKAFFLCAMVHQVSKHVSHKQGERTAFSFFF